MKQLFVRTGAVLVLASSMVPSAFALDTANLGEILQSKKVSRALRGADIRTVEVETMRCPGCYHILVSGVRLDKDTGEYRDVAAMITTRHAFRSLNQVEVDEVKETAPVHK